HPVFSNHNATTEIYPLSLHDALPIWFGVERHGDRRIVVHAQRAVGVRAHHMLGEEPPLGVAVRPEGRAHRAHVALGCLDIRERRSEEHTSELQSLTNLVCRLLLEKKK